MPSGADRRVVITGYGTMVHRIVIADFDEKTGRLTIDDRFRDDSAAEPGVNMDSKSWPHGGTAPGTPHGAVFSLPLVRSGSRGGKGAP